jgi:D-glycero-alpha-D-manno-heptose-7-phosphate kinase
MSFKVLSEQLKRLERGETVAETLKIKNIVNSMVSILEAKDFDPVQLIEPMREAWALKKQLSSSMSSSLIKELEKKLDAIGYFGYRLVGSGGGGGIILVLAPPEDHPKIKEAVRPLKTFTFNFDWEGAKVWKTC